MYSDVMYIPSPTKIGIISRQATNLSANMSCIQSVCTISIDSPSIGSGIGGGSLFGVSSSIGVELVISASSVARVVSLLLSEESLLLMLISSENQPEPNIGLIVVLVRLLLLRV